MFDALLGRSSRLPILRVGPPGAFFAASPADERGILLPKAEVPEGAQGGSEVDVFVYLDSDDRPVATTRAPKVELGQVALPG